MPSLHLVTETILPCCTAVFWHSHLSYVLAAVRQHLMQPALGQALGLHSTQPGQHRSVLVQFGWHTDRHAFPNGLTSNSKTSGRGPRFRGKRCKTEMLFLLPCIAWRAILDHAADWLRKHCGFRSDTITTACLCRPSNRVHGQCSAGRQVHTRDHARV